MLANRRTWRPRKHGPPRWWQRGITIRQRLLVVPASWVLSRLTSLVSRRTHDMGLIHAAFSRGELALFPEQQEHSYAPTLYSASFAKLRSPLDDPEFTRAADETIGQRRTLLYYDRLHVLYQALHEVVRTFPSGELRVLEGGTYRGGTAFFLSRVAERIAPERMRLWAVDTFEGHTEEDMGGVREGHQTTLANKRVPFEATLEDVTEYLSVFGSTMVIGGRIQDVANRLPGPPLHLVHLDMNVYKPTLFGLELARERLERGGIVILDDYGNVHCPGVSKAVEEVLARHDGAFTRLVLPTGQCWLVALGGGVRAGEKVGAAFE